MNQKVMRWMRSLYLSLYIRHLDGCGIAVGDTTAVYLALGRIDQWHQFNEAKICSLTTFQTIRQHNY